MRDQYERFEQAGLQVAAVTLAEPEQAAEFKQQFQLPYDVLCDPRQRAYLAFGLTRGGALQVVGPGIWWRGLKATLAHGFGKPGKDVWQLSGEFVLDTHGTIRLAHRGKNSADTMPVEDLLGALRGCD